MLLTLGDAANFPVLFQKTNNTTPTTATTTAMSSSGNCSGGGSGGASISAGSEYAQLLFDRILVRQVRVHVCVNMTAQVTICNTDEATDGHGHAQMSMSAPRN